MKLIDAEVMEKQLGRFVTSNLGEIKASDIKQFIQEQPTAYDVEKVIDELEGCICDSTTMDEGLDGWDSGIRHAIVVIKKGGV